MRARILAAAVVWLCLDHGAAQAKVRIVASITDLGSIAAGVGGDRVEVVSIARATADAHRVEVLPSYMVRVARADLYLKVGLGLDVWADAIVDGSHNNKLLVVDCSKGVAVLEKPTGKVDASMGDVHPDGNPHYWLDPRNGAIVARTVAEALGRVDAANATEYASRAAEIAQRCETLVETGRRTLAALPSHEILTYHRSWSYFANAFGVEVVSTIEPIPGIPPTARHLNELIELIRERKVQVAISEPYFSEDAGALLARQTGIRILHLSPSCDDTTPGSYTAHFERLLAAIAGAPAAAGGD